MRAHFPQQRLVIEPTTRQDGVENRDNYDWHGARAALILYDQVLNSSSRDIYLNLSEICQHQQQLEHLSFFQGKVQVNRFTQNHLA